VVGLLDRQSVPDGFPFVTDDDGGRRGCRFLNGYLIAALRQDACALDNLKNNHLYHLVRFLRSVRRRRAEAVSGLTGDRLDEWLTAQGEPLADLTDATRQDLLDYKRSRQDSLKATSWEAESGPISLFIRLREVCWLDHRRPGAPVGHSPAEYLPRPRFGYPADPVPDRAAAASVSACWAAGRGARPSRVGTSLPRA
jgi:hypothetical protein